MMQCLKIYWSLLIFLMVWISANGQNTELDSLKILLNNTVNDSAKVKLLKRVGDGFYQINFDSTIYYYELTLKVSEKSPYYDVELSTLRSFGYVYANQKNDFDLAIKYFNKALKHTEEAFDSLAIAYVLSDIGRIYWKQGKSYQALEYHLKVRHIGEKINNPKVLMRSNLSLGIIENENGSNSKAKEYYRTALPLADSLKRYKVKGLILNNLGKAYQDDSEFKDAYNYLTKADSIFLQLDDFGNLSLTRYNLGKNYTLDNQPNKGIELFSEAIDFNKKIGNQEREVMILLGLSEAYQKINQPQEAISIGEKALRILKEIDTDLYYDELYLSLAQSYDSIQNHRSASLNYSNYIERNSYSEVKERVQKIASLNHMFELEKRENQILELKTKDLEREKDLEISQANLKLMGMVIIALLLLSLLYFYWNKVQNLKKIEQLKIDLSSDLHDNIGASLSHIKMLSSRLDKNSISKEEKAKTIFKIKNISNELMYDMHDMLWSLDTTKESINNLLDRIQDYTDNTLSDFEIPYNFSINLENQNVKLDTKEKLNTYLIFKEAINNILKHTKSENVLISFERGKKKFFKMIINNIYCQTIKGDYPSGKKGINNMKSRASEIGGNLEVIDEDGNFSIVLTI